jgi:hypothetical protein
LHHELPYYIVDGYTDKESKLLEALVAQDRQIHFYWGSAPGRLGYLYPLGSPFDRLSP